MHSFPLIRTKWSNERIMTLLVFVLVLYELPRSIAKPEEAGGLLLLMIFALVLDTAINYFRYKRPICAVSAAVTVLVLHVASPGVPLWGQLITLAVALVVGKHIWGGTGKNPINPAIFGLLLLGMLYPEKHPIFGSSFLLIPAAILSLPFLFFRPYAGLGMMAGIAAALLLKGELSFQNLLSVGLTFWGCLIITDPVTITSKPIPGAAAGLLAGFVPMLTSGTTAAISLGILAANIISYVSDYFLSDTGIKLHLKVGRKRRLAFSGIDMPFNDFTDLTKAICINDIVYSRDDILGSIEHNMVYGFGGAAYPTALKIKAVMISKAPNKHLIINSAECDPGLVHDKWLLLNRTNDICQGIKLLRRCISLTDVSIAAKDTSILDFGPDVQIHQVKDYYPVGAERTLIKEVLKTDLPYGIRPAEVGILVLNVQTVLAVYEAVCHDRMANTKYITVLNTDEMTGSVAKVALGATVHDIIKKHYSDYSCVFTGGGIMDARVADEDAIVQKETNCIAVGKYPGYRNSPLCSGCGLCNAVCPALLNVSKIADLIQNGKAVEATKYHPEKCLSCGSCSYVCLAGRNLAASVKNAKNLSI